MKQYFFAALCAATVLSAAACFKLQIHPATFNAPAPKLDIAPERRLPLRVAVVIPDPMAFRYYYTPPSRAAGGKRRMDQTDQMGGEKNLPISGELARLAAETFPSAFQNVAVLRHLPGPGEYDAVVEFSVVSLDQAAEIRSGGFGGADNELWMDWRISVLDKSNAEIYSAKETTPKRRFNIKAGFSAEPMIAALGREGGELLATVTREAALAAYDRLSRAPAGK